MADNPLLRPLVFGDVAQIKAIHSLRDEAEREENAEENGGGWFRVEIEISASEVAWFDEKPSMYDFDLSDYIDTHDMDVTFIKCDKKGKITAKSN